MRSDVKNLVKPRLIQMFGYPPFRKVMCWSVPKHHAPRHIALTFDDGPHGTYTPQVLDLLAKNNIRGTFFVLGSYIENHPDIFRRLLDDGHEFGIHGYVHNNIELPRQTLRTMKVVEKFGATSSLFRPPHGRLDLRTSVWMARKGFSTVLWSFDCRDSLRYEGKDSSRRPLDDIAPGDIVLLHDDNPVCVSDLTAIIDMLKARNLQTRTVSQMLAIE